MRSEEVKLGSTRAAHRSLFYAMGYTEEDLKKPLIGVVNAQNEIIPGHMHLDQIAKAVKHGILAAGGTPIEFPAIGICDGIAMGHNGMKYPLASRELVADSIEAVANGHAFDGLVLIPNCDKIVPGMLMDHAFEELGVLYALGFPEIECERTGYRVYLVDVYLVGCHIYHEVDTGNAVAAEVAECVNCYFSYILVLFGSDLSGYLSFQGSHALAAAGLSAADILLIEAEDIVLACLNGFFANGSFCLLAVSDYRAVYLFELNNGRLYEDTVRELESLLH